MKLSTKDLAYMALYLALFAVLDFITQRIPILQMPNGGSIGLSVIALLLASYHLGWQKGVLTALLSVVIQGLSGPIYFVNALDFVFEYLIAFGVYGFAVIFKKIKLFGITIETGILSTNLIRFVMHLIAGVYFWGSPWEASFVYNFGYMAATTIMTLLVVPLLAVHLKRLK